MSKASEFAKRRPRPITIRDFSDTLSKSQQYEAWVDDETGGMRLDNYGPFPSKEALRLGRWIVATFGEFGEKEKKTGRKKR